MLKVITHTFNWKIWNSHMYFNYCKEKFCPLERAGIWPLFFISIKKIISEDNNSLRDSNPQPLSS